LTNKKQQESCQLRKLCYMYGWHNHHTV